MKKLLLLSALFIFACSDDEGNPCIYEPTLTTQAATDVTQTSATLNGIISIVSENCDVPNNTEQGFVYSTEIQPTLEDIQVNVNGTNISTTIEGLTPNTTYYVRAFLTNNFGDFYGDEISFITQDNTLDCDVVYLDENGVTIKAYPCAIIGDIGVIDGLTYTIVNKNILMEMIESNMDLTKICTSKITDLSRPISGPYVSLFGSGEIASYEFNQDISSWDVSNVINMGGMFRYEIIFNQDISNWDVSNVTNMDSMFSNAELFNQPIGSWDVSNVTDMSRMFNNTSFNQDISNWDVSNVTNISFMFNGSISIPTIFNQPIGSWDVSNVNNMRGLFWHNISFNQPIGNWDVSNVTDISFMFGGTLASNVSVPNIFNQPIGNWDVSNVTDMHSMFSGNNYFNQDISNWDVSNVADISFMFNNTSFNQDISNWDVSNVTNMRHMFSGWSAYQGIFNQDISNWDVSNVTNMDSMFYLAESFNQDLNTWSVSNVTDCMDFSFDTPQWTLPQPNFTNCTP